MAATTKARRNGASAFAVLMVMAAAVGCSGKGSGTAGGQAVQSQGQALGTQTSVVLSVPNPLSPVGPVLTGVTSVRLGANADVISGAVVAMGTTGLDAEPGALVNDDVWSRGTATLKDRVTVKGTLHAATVSLGSSVAIAARDTAPRFDPPSTLSWTVTYPSGTPSNVTLNLGQAQTLAPGLYGTVLLNSRSTLTLSSGTYYFTDFEVNAQSTVNLEQGNGPVVVYALNNLLLRGTFVPVESGDAGTVHPDLMIGYLGSAAVYVESLFDGAIVAPFAPLTLRDVSGVHTGYFYAQSIASVDPSTQVQYRLPAAVVGAANPPGPECNALLSSAGIPQDRLRLYCKTCSSPDDTDHDGVPDCVDGCPYDHFKNAPGECGCNIADVDSDGDGVPDCIDLCPNDPNNVSPGQCGCVGQVAFADSGTVAPTPAPAGTPCSDTACPQAGPTCNGAGVCGNRSACAPCAGGKLLEENGIAYWFCGNTFPPETGPDGGVEQPNSGSGATQSGAEGACSGKGLTLARINTADQNRFVAQFITAPLWLGANDLTTSGQWRWSLPNSNNGDLFWSGGPTGAAQSNRYSSWASGAPGSARCASMQPVNGHWVDTDCSETLGYMCEFIAPLQGAPPSVGTFGGGGGAGGAHPSVAFEGDACVPEFIPDAGGLPDSLTELENELDAAKNKVFIGAAANPPPDGSVCVSDDAAPSEAIGLGGTNVGCVVTDTKLIIDINNGGAIDCMSDNDCAPFGGGYFCRQQKNSPTCEPPDAGTGATSPDTGPAPPCPGHASCVKLSCPVDLNKNCSEVRICSTTNTSFEAGLDPTSDLDAGVFNPASLFEGGVLPDAGPVGTYFDPPDGDGPDHTWCHMDPQNPVPSANQAPLTTQGSSGSGSTINFAFDPNLVFDVNVNPLAMGENGMDVHAAASLVATVHLNNFLGQSYTADIVDVGVGIHAQRCSVNNDDTQFTVLDIDILPLLGLGIPQFDSTTLAPTLTSECNNAVGDFTYWASRAKKAFRDAQQLLLQYQAAKDGGLNLESTLCQDILGNVPANDVALFPGGLQCPAGETPEETINRFVDYLQAPGFGQLSQLRSAASNLVNKSAAFFTGVVEPLSGPPFGKFPGIQKDESQTILNVPFAIGPVPMVLQVDVFAKYGLTGSFIPTINFPFKQLAGLDDSNPSGTPVPIARIEVDALPYAAAGLSAFVGAGVDLGAFSATVGIEGSVTLGEVQAPIYAGAGFDMAELSDPRPVPADIAQVSLPSLPSASNLLGSQFHFSLPKAYQFRVWFDYGLGIQLDNILSGEIDSRLQISFFFFSKTWRKQIVSFKGWSARYNLIQGGGGVGTVTSGSPTPLSTPNMPQMDGQAPVVTTGDNGPAMGMSQQQLPFTILQRLPVPQDGGLTAESDAGTVPVDKTAVQSFLYDNQCCSQATQFCVPAGAPQCCPDLTCSFTLPDSMGTKGVCVPACVNDGGACRPGAATTGCCGSLVCLNNACQPPPPPPPPPPECLGFLASCTSNAQCCSVSCSDAGVCGENVP